MANKKDVSDAAWKLARFVQGGAVGYYAGGKVSKALGSTLSEDLVKVVERHKKVNLAAGLTQSFIPGAAIAASAAMVASIWKMYYDINQVLGIKISDNVGKSLTSAVLTNIASFGATGVATAVSEGAKLIPFVGWLASAAITTVSSTAIVYGSAHLYLKALTKMYEVEGGFNLDFLKSELSNDGKGNLDDDNEIDRDNRMRHKAYQVIEVIADQLGVATEEIQPQCDIEEDLGADDLDKIEIIRELQSTFGVNIEKEEDEFSFVDDFIEEITGISFWDEDFSNYDPNADDDSIYGEEGESADPYDKNDDIYEDEDDEEEGVYMITDDCVMCGTCEMECPEDAIFEGEDKYEIDSNLCLGCGLCADTCPSNAIIFDL